MERSPDGWIIAFLDRVEELAADSGVAAFVAGLPVGCVVLRRGVALGELGGDQLVEEPGGGGARMFRIAEHACGRSRSVANAGDLMY